MLTWALSWLFYNAQAQGDAIGVLLFFSMIFDVIIICAITACWWGKYIK